MDHRRFDTLTRSVAAPRSRRGFLGALSAVGAGLLAGRHADAQQVTQAYCGNVSCKSTPATCRPGCVCCVFPNGTSRCTPPNSCRAGVVALPPPVVITSGTVSGDDPTSGCTFNCPYDAFTFQHGGGQLSLNVRGADSGGGTIQDPYLQLFSGGSVPNDGVCASSVGYDDDSGCGYDSYLEFSSLAAGTYTAAIRDFGCNLGTYTLELNTFGTGICAA